MLNRNIENPLAKFLYIGAPFIALLVSAYTNTDPVNAPKALALGAFSFGAVAIAVRYGIGQLWRDSKSAIILASLFLLFIISSVIFSASPLDQLLYGVGGRNTGSVTYFGLTFLFIASLLIRSHKNFRNIVWALMFTGLVNFFYNLIVLFGEDPIPWNNTYGTILGTFGNPNFISAFMSFFISMTAAILFQSRLDLKFRFLGVVLILVSLYEVKRSFSLQGLIASALGFTIVGYFVVRSKFENKWFSRTYLLAALLGGMLVIAGMLQKGPLVNLVYKRTISLRGEYWHAGWNMGSSRPFSGLGMDSYGLWYRRLRNQSALINPGPDTITNSAHNVFMDIFSGGGFPLFVIYLLISALVIQSVIKIAKRNQSYDAVFVALTVGWICYQAQSLISINQIGLAVWGWLFGGALIAYEISSRNPNFYIGEAQGVKKSKGIRKSQNSSGETPAGVTLIAFIGFVVGIVVASPPAISDAKWRSALSSGNIDKIQTALGSWPKDSSRLAQATGILSDNKLDDLAYKYAKLGTEINPDFFDAWRLLAAMKLATDADKKLSAENLYRLDPMNPAYKLVP
jgi:O-antigen ligase